LSVTGALISPPQRTGCSTRLFGMCDPKLRRPGYC
jgi:hypothetical protein